MASNDLLARMLLQQSPQLPTAGQAVALARGKPPPDATWNAGQAYIAPSTMVRRGLENVMGVGRARSLLDEQPLFSGAADILGDIGDATSMGSRNVVQGLQQNDPGRAAGGALDVAINEPMGLAAGAALKGTGLGAMKAMAMLPGPAKKKISAGAAKAAELLERGITKVDKALGGAGDVPLEELLQNTPGRYSEPKLPVQGQLGLPDSERIPVTWKGKHPDQWTPQDFHDFGMNYGVPNFGPADEAAWREGLQTHRLLSGRDVTLPNLDKPLTFYDLMQIQAQGLSPTEMTPEFAQRLHDAMISAHQPQGQISDPRVLNGYLMGITSPNNGLLNNMATMSRAMVRGPQDVDTLAGMVPWNYQDIPAFDVRQPFATNPKTGKLLKNAEGKPYRTNPESDAIAQQLNVHEAPGMGSRGSQDMTTLATLAQGFRDNPDFYRFDPKNFPASYTPEEQWAAHVERIMNATRGLSAKTGSFGSVWQSPQDAAISAIDRHMASKMHEDLFTNEAERLKWEGETVGKFNKQNAAAFNDKTLEKYNKDQLIAQLKSNKKFVGPPGAGNYAPSIEDMPNYKPQIDTFDQLKDIEGGHGFIVDASQNYLNNAKSMKTILAKTGAYNSRLPEHLKNHAWPGGLEPPDMSVLPEPYTRALTKNASDAAEKGQGLFSNQWFNWDPIRGRVETHHIMWPGLEQLPPMTNAQTSKVFDRYKELGYATAPNPVRSTKNPAELAFWAAMLGLGGAGAAAVSGAARPGGAPTQPVY